MHSSLIAPTVRSHTCYAGRVEAAGGGIIRWSLVLLLLFFGVLKWTVAEATAITPFIANSPILRWMGPVFGVQGSSEFIGVLELLIAALIASRHFAPRLSMAGGFLGTIMFLTTLSFIFTTPGVGDGVPFLLEGSDTSRRRAVDRWRIMAGR